MSTKMLVYIRPLEGKEDEFNDWYNNIHLQEVVAIDGFISAQRYELTAAQQMPDQDYKYLALYELDDENVATTVENLLAASGTMNMGDSVDLGSTKVSIFTSITQVVA